MYFIFRYAHHVLDIEVIVISVSYGVQYIISLIYCRVQLVSRLAGVCQRLRVLKIQGRGRELMIGVDSCWKVADDESNIYPILPDPQSRRVPFTDYGWYMRRNLKQPRKQPGRVHLFALLGLGLVHSSK
jgi:hypothetical protein